MEEDDTEHPEYLGSNEEDNILYAGTEEASVDDATTLLFIHQLEQQLEIWKRCQTKLKEPYEQKL